MPRVSDRPRPDHHTQHMRVGSGPLRRVVLVLGVGRLPSRPVRESVRLLVSVMGSWRVLACGVVLCERASERAVGLDFWWVGRYSVLLQDWMDGDGGELEAHVREVEVNSGAVDEVGDGGRTTGMGRNLREVR
jgi:hypothetical protein